MRLNSPYKKLIDSAILHLKEGGVLHRYYTFFLKNRHFYFLYKKPPRLKKKWWKTKRGGGACDAAEEGGGVKPLDLANVAGVFLVTVLGCIVAV